jgi:hypothetical protein
VLVNIFIGYDCHLYIVNSIQVGTDITTPCHEDGKLYEPLTSFVKIRVIQLCYRIPAIPLYLPEIL